MPHTKNNKFPPPKKQTLCGGKIYDAGTAMKKFSVFIKKIIEILPRVRPGVYASALAFHMTMTFFPLLICLYTLLGNSYDSLMRILRIAEGVLAEGTLNLIYDFAEYIAANNSPAMMAAAIAVLLTSSSAAIRMIHWAIGKMQGGDRFKDVWEIAISFPFSLVFLAAIYFAVIVMFTGKNFIDLMNRYVPYFDIRSSWNFLRYVLLAAIFFVLLTLLFRSARRKTDTYSILPGSSIAAVAVVLASFFFSVIITKSIKYSLVYGSLASIVLLMLWLYWCCFAIIFGAAINVAIRDTREALLQAAIAEERKKKIRT